MVSGDSEIFYTIYKTTNVLNGKIYIGKHKTKNPNDEYLGSGHLIQLAIKKYGKVNFVKEVLFVFGSEIEMNAKERELVTEEFVLQDTNYNLCTGGDGGFGYINRELTEVVKGYAWINREGLNNKKIQNKVAAEKIKTDPEFKKFFSEKISHGLANRKKKDSWVEATSQLNSPESMLKKKATWAKNNHQKGKNNSQFGSFWITNGIENRKLRMGEEIPNCWKKGRI